jgi:ribonuclease G
MSRRILIHSGIAETRIAQVSDGALERYWSEPRFLGETAGVRVGDIIFTRVKRVLPAINAAFLDIGTERDGFLSARDAQIRASGARASGTISECVHEGEAILVQVLRDPSDDKGARLSVEITLAGRYAVFAPEGGRVTLSRKIEDEEERRRLKAIMEDMREAGSGFVVRTAAIGAAETSLREDAAYLTKFWREIAAKAGEIDPPETLYREPGLIERVLRDHAGPEIEKVVTGDLSALNAAKNYAQAAMPDFAERIVLHEGKAALFEDYGIEDAIAELSDAEIPLPSGGWITIEPTEAMTTIDVNSGRQTARGDLDATALQTDLEAAEMIARQLVLRGAGGLIAIDFIPVSGDDAFEKITARLREALKEVGLAGEVAQLPRMNLVALTLRRSHASHAERATEQCGHCGGRGARASVETIALEALHLVEASAAAAPGAGIAMRVSGEVGAWLEAHSKELRAELARRGITALRVFPEKGRAREDFSVETTVTEAAK